MQPIIAAADGVSPIPSTQTAGEYLTFRLGAEAYGIRILTVQEIRGFEAPIRMVNAPSHVLGVQNLRGVIVPNVDLRLKFGLPDVVYDAQTVIIVLSLNDRVVGVVVDAVSDVVALTDAQVRPAPEFSGAISEHAVIGLATLDQSQANGMVILLDIEHLMRSGDMGLVSAMLQ